MKQPKLPFILIGIACLAIIVGCSRDAATPTNDPNALKTTLTKVIDQTKALEAKLATSPAMKTMATQVMSALESNNDFAVLNSLQTLSSAKLTDGQMSMVTELRSNVEMYVLNRNFDATDSSIQGPLSEMLKAIKGNNIEGILTGAQELMKQGELSPQQLNLLQLVMKGHGGDLAEQAKGIASGLFGNSL